MAVRTYFAGRRGRDDHPRRIAAGDWLGGEVFYQSPLYPYFLGALYTLFGDGKAAGSLFLGLDSVIGPVYLGGMVTSVEIAVSGDGEVDAESAVNLYDVTLKVAFAL